MTLLLVQPPERAPLASLEAEQALLGAILYDNGAFERVPDQLRGEHFYEPLHQRLFASMADLIGKNRLAEPFILRDKFQADQSFIEFGGLAYLVGLVDHAPPYTAAKDHADQVYDLAIRRELMRIGADLSVSAADHDRTGLEHVQDAEEALFGLAEKGEANQGLLPFAGHVQLAVETAAESFGRDGGLAGLATGLLDIDQKLGGLHPSDLLIIAGRPSMGKSSLAVNIAYNIAKQYRAGADKPVAGGRVAFFSLEMSGDQLAARIISEASGIPSDRVRRGDIQPSEFGRYRDAALEIEHIPLYIDASGGLSIGKLCARARRMKRRHGLELVVVDYLQLCTVSGGGQNRVQDVSMITQGLKALAKELSVPVIALSQLSRQVESRDDKRPMLSDLRESGSIEQDSDVVMFVFREAYYLERAEPKPGTGEHHDWIQRMNEVQSLAEVIIGKQRHGPIGTVKLHFSSDLTKFGNLARDGFYGANVVDFSEPRGGRE
jgi:replicative DNA helicase